MPDAWGSSSPSLPTSVSISTWTASPYAPNVKWMYNGRVRGSLWFTILAKSTCSGRCSNPSLSLFTPLHCCLHGLTSAGLNLYLSKFVFSTVSLARPLQNKSIMTHLKQSSGAPVTVAGEKMETNELPQETKVIPNKPDKVSLATKLLYASLGISLISILAQAPQAPASLTMFFIVIPLISIGIMGFLFYMIDKGKNWARITYLVLTILSIPSMFTVLQSFSEALLRNLIGIVGLIS